MNLAWQPATGAAFNHGLLPRTSMDCLYNQLVTRSRAISTFIFLELWFCLGTALAANRPERIVVASLGVAAAALAVWVLTDHLRKG